MNIKKIGLVKVQTKWIKYSDKYLNILFQDTS